MRHTYIFNTVVSDSKKEQYTKGYIALMATIVIGAVLLVMTVSMTKAGWYARFNILGIEAKEQSASLAEGCGNQALALLIADSSYQGNATTTVEVGTCYIFPITLNSPLLGIVTLRVQGRVRDAYTNLEMQIDMKDIKIDSVPLPEPIVIPPAPLNFTVRLHSWKEVPKLP